MADERDDTRQRTDGVAQSNERFELSRRTVMAGAAGMATLSIPSGFAAADVNADGHTLATYRALVDGIVPRTPQLGGEQVPGAADVELEKFLIYNVNYGSDLPSIDQITGDLASSLEVDLPSASDALESLIERLESLLGFSVTDALGITRDEVFGALEGISLSIGDDTSILTVESDANGDGNVETTRKEQATISIASIFAMILDLFAVVFVWRGKNEDLPSTSPAVENGGFFTYLSETDRARCLEYVIDISDPLGGLEDEILPIPDLLEKIAVNCFVLTYFGYYNEWAGYGDTKTDAPNDRELQKPSSEVQGHRQVGYPGPAKGYADFRGFPIDGFRDNDWDSGGDDGWF
ncbi:hypothetical protein ACOZ4N_06675 [Halorientalis pallida]|uniref:hypothetical protein n=1 Tax=Halorientalis pallida TaxID=2479928 RepID=UPI003C6F1D50